MSRTFEKGEKTEIKIDEKFLYDNGDPVRFIMQIRPDCISLLPVYSDEDGYEALELEEGRQFEFMEGMPRVKREKRK